MRPVRRPRWQVDWQGKRSADVALHALGRFCGACEQPLPAQAVAWDHGRWAPAPEQAAPEHWDALIALCPMCAQAATATARGEALLPDRDATFTLGAGSPLSYEPRTLRVVHADGTDDPAGEVERVVAVAGSPRGQATIDAFALNTPYHRSGDALVLPEGMDLAAAEFADPRLELRTAAWQDARWYAGSLHDAGGPAQTDDLARSVGRLLPRCGFWSVWATVLAAALADGTLLTRLLLPPAAAGETARQTAGPHPFPATRADALRPAAPDDGGT